MDELDPTRFYSKNDIISNKLIPWIKHEQTLRNLISSGELQTAFQSTGKTSYGNRYFILGKDLIEYINKYSTK